MLKFAIIGCGNIAQKSVIPALMKSGVSKIEVCIDTDINKGKEVKSKFELPFETNLKKALSNYDFDAVYISTPIATHKNIIIEVAKHKKQILCEKSIVSNPEEAKAVIDFCEKQDVALFEGFMYKFHSQHKFVNNLIENGEIGTPFHFQAWFGFPPISRQDFRYNKSLGGGAILDAGSYTVNASRYFFNSEPINVSSVIETEGEDVEIRGTAMLNFGNSKTAHLVFGFNNMYQNKYSIWGTKGIISLERAFALPPDFKSTLVLKKQGEVKEFSMEPCNHFIEEIRYFTKYFNDNEYKVKWRTEIINQANSLNYIRQNSLGL